MEQGVSTSLPSLLTTMRNPLPDGALPEWYVTFSLLVQEKIGVGGDFFFPHSDKKASEFMPTNCREENVGCF